MSDDEDSTLNGTLSARDDDGADNDDRKGSSSDDDSSSSSSGSSSDSDSDSDSDKDGDDDDSAKSSRSAEDRKYSIESLSGSSAGSKALSGGARDKGNEPINVNPTLAAARFREQANTEPGLMALGTRKRDRRTIEEIQRDIQKKRGKQATASQSGSIPPAKKPLGGSVPVARASPPKSSPVMSPESGNELDRINLTIGGAVGGGVKSKTANSARSRLEKKLLGRGGGGSSAARTPTQAKKLASAARAGSASTTPATGMVTNISAGKVVRQGGNSGSGSDQDMESRVMEPKIEPRVIDNSKPDGRVVRSVLRSMLRYGDLTDVNLFPGDHHKSFADEYKLPNFVERANLVALCKMSEDKLLKLACEIADGVQRVLDDNKDVLKFADVEMKPSQIVERLYENLKLRVAVQRALYDIGASTSKSNNPVYSLVSKNYDTSVLGIGRDFPAWTWAEKEHDWNTKKDAALLFGIYIHGFGAWEDILNDDRLMMQQQRALKGERLKKRAENLLKRVPPPLSGSAGEPRLVQIATTMLNGSQNPTQALGAQISAIVNGASVKGGRMQRAAERHAARAAGAANDSGRDVIPEDSIRKVHTQNSDRERDRSHERSREREQDQSRDRERERDRDRPPPHRKPSVSSPARSVPSRSPRAGSASDDGRVSSSVSGRKEHSKPTSTKRSSSDDTSGSVRNGETGNTFDTEHSPRKKSKHHDGDVTHSKDKSLASVPPDTSQSLSKRQLNEDKWKPKKRLEEIRQVLKKMRVMGEWSKKQSDVVVVEKMFEYVATIGEQIDKVVIESERRGEVAEKEWDEFCTTLWTYAAEHTPFPPVAFERLYDDICADGERLRESSKQSMRRPA